MSDVAEPVPTAPLLTPAGGVPELTASAGALAEVAVRLSGGTGPIALDTERASGFRYSGRAYLIQLRRAGAGSVLLDPIGLGPAMSPLASALDGPEWVLHAASQDLPCLAELGLYPAALFDTELAGRLAGFERVGLAAIVERVLGLGLVKGHGADDWSKRPLPPSWLVYAALDVEVLLELRDALAGELAAQDKTAWAAQEFEHVRTAGAPKPKAERWRRTSGIHKVHKRRQLAAVRELWLERDRLAAARDIAPGRVLPDSAISAAALADPKDLTALTALPVFGGRMQRRQAHTWWSALQRAHALADDELPGASAPHDGPPPVSRWSDRDPEAAARMVAARSALTALSEEHRVPVENLLLPDLLRRICWAPPQERDVETVTELLRVGGARPWQRALVAHPLALALRAPGPAGS
ncbi:MAG: ribonuclease D [Mycobacteriaceae bacterium]